MVTRDELRTIALKSKQKKRKSFTYEGNEFQILEPTVREFMDITKKAKGDALAHSVWTIICLTVVPDTDQKVFEDTDFDSFMGQTFDGFMLSAKEAVAEIFETMQDTGKI